MYISDIKEEDREEALQAAVILLPDENREALQALLSFLNDVSIRSAENQVSSEQPGIFYIIILSLGSDHLII